MELSELVQESLKKFRIQSSAIKDSIQSSRISPLGKFRGREVSTHKPENQKLEERIAFKATLSR